MSLNPPRPPRRDRGHAERKMGRYRRWVVARGRRGVSLVELLVVVAIVGILMALLFPAIQSARETARRVQCANNEKQLALACQSFHDTYKMLPYGRKYDVWDTYTWSENILPYLEMGTVFDGFWTLSSQGFKATYPGPNGPLGDDPRLRQSRHARSSIFLCPSNGQAKENEINTLPYGYVRGNYRGCVGAGDMYGTATDTSRGPWGRGVFGVVPGQSFDETAPVHTVGVRFGELVDGTSNTLLVSEGICPTVSSWGGPLGATLLGNMGGGLFSCSLTPNSSAPDRVIGPCPQNQGDVRYKAPCMSLGTNAWWSPSGALAQAAARSFHSGGVNAALADGSVEFVSNSIDLRVWRELGARTGRDTATPIR